MFAAVLAYNRFEFTLSKDDNWQEKQDRLKVAALLDAASDLFESQHLVLANLEGITSGLRSAAQLDSLVPQRGEAEAELKELDGKVRRHLGWGLGFRLR